MLSKQGYYEDRSGFNADGSNIGNEFYLRRYYAALDVTHQFFKDFYLSGTTDENNETIIKIFIPRNLLPIYTKPKEVRKYCIKLDQFYNYLCDFDPDSATLKASQWTSGDTLFHFTTIIYNGEYFIDPSTYRDDDPSTSENESEKPLYYKTVFPYADGRTATSFYK